MATTYTDRRVHPARKALRVLAVAVTGLAAMGLAAACEPAECTTTFVAAPGPASWADPGSWSAGAVPTASDIACIGTGWDVQLPSGSVTVKGLKLASNLYLTQTTFAVLNSQIQGATTATFSLDQSSISIGGGTGNLTLDGGELNGFGDIYGTVSGASVISPGTSSGSDLGVITVHGDLLVDATWIPLSLSAFAWDHIVVTGAFNATEATALNLTFLPDFAPVAYRRTLPLVGAASKAGDPQVYGVPDYRGTGWGLKISFAIGVHLLSTDCDLDVFGPYTTYTASLANKDLRLCELYTSSFAGVDLRNTDLSEAILWDASFSGANLSGANLSRAYVDGADLSTATLTGLRSGGTVGQPALPAGWAAIRGYLVGPGANLTNADLSGLDLTGFDLTGATLKGANLTGTTLAGATLAGVRSGGVIGTPSAVPAGWHVLSGYLLGPGADLTAANLSGLNLAGFDLTGATLSQANLAGTSFTGAVLAKVRSGGVTGAPAALPTNWQVRGGFLAGPGASFVGANLTGVDLSAMNLTGADFTSANISSVDLRNATLRAVRSGGTLAFSGVASLPYDWALRGGFLVGPGADLSGRTLYATDLASLDLTGVNFTNATLDSVRVSGTNWNNVTINGMRGRNLLGSPSVLPPTMGVVGGYFIGPNVNLSGVTMGYYDIMAPLSLAGADLTNATFVGSNLYGLSLVNANLTGARIFDSYITRVDMTGANMGGVPVGATFGSNLLYKNGDTTFTPPAGWVVDGTLGFLPPFFLRRVS